MTQEIVVKVGKKYLRVAMAAFKGKPQLRVEEVTPDVDLESGQLKGWAAVYGGSMLVGAPEELSVLAGAIKEAARVAASP